MILKTITTLETINFDASPNTTNFANSIGTYNDEVFSNYGLTLGRHHCLLLLPPPFSLRCPPPALVAASAMTLPSLSSPHPPPHCQTTMSSVVISMVGGGTTDGVTAATAPLYHNHHLDCPRCHAPPFHLPLSVDT